MDNCEFVRLPSQLAISRIKMASGARGKHSETAIQVSPERVACPVKEMPLNRMDTMSRIQAEVNNLSLA